MTNEEYLELEPVVDKAVADAPVRWEVGCALRVLSTSILSGQFKDRQLDPVTVAELLRGIANRVEFGSKNEDWDTNLIGRVEREIEEDCD